MMAIVLSLLGLTYGFVPQIHSFVTPDGGQLAAISWFLLASLALVAMGNRGGETMKDCETQWVTLKLRFGSAPLTSSRSTGTCVICRLGCLNYKIRSGVAWPRIARQRRTNAGCAEPEPVHRWRRSETAR